MSVELRLPDIQGETTAQRLGAMQSYLYRLVQQLNWALNTVSADAAGQTAQQANTGSGTAATPAQQAESFNEIKSLIIKSAEIVNAYYDTISRRLEGIYVAQSDYGVFREATQNGITANSTGITQLMTDVQAIQTDVVKVLETNAWTRTGLLGYDGEGVPIYGFEVGQMTGSEGAEVFHKYARFTAGGIYFYLPGITDAVAWMTGNKLYITNAEITGSLQLGHYTLDLSSGATWRWVG